MEKQDVEEEEAMEVDAQHQKGDIGNSNAEDGRQLFQKDTEILLVLLPAKVWVNVTDMLLADHCTDDLTNFCNASPFFRDLILSKRVLFLCPQVLKIIGPRHLENEEHAIEEDKSSSLLRCRPVCKSWNKSVDQYINGSGFQTEFFRDPPRVPNVPRNPSLISTRYKYFGFMAPLRLQNFLDHFEKSHPPLDSRPQRNPFIGTTVALCHYEYTYENRQLGANILELLRKYGQHQHIRVLVLGLSTSANEKLENYLWLKECLECTPNLTHLKVKQLPDYQGYNNGAREMDPFFGEHAYRSGEFGEYLRKRILSEMTALPAAVQQQICVDVLQLHQDMMRTIGADRRENQDYDFEMYLANIASAQGDNAGLREIREQERNQRRAQNGNAPPEPPRLNENEFGNAAAEDPLPLLGNLECLKLCKLSARVFNPLIGSNRFVSWLHMDPIVPYDGLGQERYVDWWKLDFPNLRKLYIRFPGGSEEVRKLKNVHSSFKKLTSLHLDYPYARDRDDFMGWAEIFQILEENWADTLIELKIRLPMPRTEADKDEVRSAAENGRLALPKLKRLVMWVPNPTAAFHYYFKFQCLDSIRGNLEELVVLYQ